MKESESVVLSAAAVDDAAKSHISSREGKNCHRRPC